MTKKNFDVMVGYIWHDDKCTYRKVVGSLARIVNMWNP